MTNQEERALKALAARVRIGALDAIHSLGSGHIGGSLSIADVLAALYGREMKYDPKDPTMPERDKLVCSKGHAGPAVYSVLANEGFFPYEELTTLNRPGTRLPSHCDRNKTPGVDMTTGSLGQGTSIACGMALADRLHGYSSRTFVIVGDGVLVRYTGKTKDVVVPDTVKYISNAFYFNGAVKTVTLPASVKSVGRFAFYTCGKLESVTLTSSITNIDKEAFVDNSALKTIIAPADSYAAKTMSARGFKVSAK